MMGYYGYGYSNMMGYFGGGIMMLVVWVALVLFIIWLIKEITRDGRSNSKALDILKSRYASGEIDKAEFEQKKKDLLK